MPNGAELDLIKSEAVPVLDRVGYSEKEQEYFIFLKKRLEDARDRRDQIHVQFDSMSFLGYLDNNERMWNATIEPKTDVRDWRSNARKRSVFHKGIAILGKLLDENFMSEFTAYDEESQLDQELGHALTDAVLATKERENSEEIEYLAGQELLKHGFVPIQEVFEVSDRIIKELDPVDWSVGVAADKRTWKEKTVPYKRQCVKRVIRNDSLYLGNIFLGPHEFDRQPYIFVRSYKSYEEAKSIFGKFARWKSVKPGMGQETGHARVAYLDHWRLGSLNEGEVEIIEYQDKWNDEYQIIINGVMMLPVGFPLPWASKEYNITFRTLYAISHTFAYAHGLAHIMRSNSQIHDFLLRYMVDKSFQDLLPPFVTKSQRALSSSIFIPGRVTHDVSPEDVQPLLQTGLPASSTQMLEYFEQSLDEDSIAKVVAGQDSPGAATAYEISQQMKQAMKALGPIVFSFMWMIRDLDMMRAQNILENLARPKEKKIDEDSKEIVSVYEKLVLEDADLPDGGRGMHIIEFGDGENAPDSYELFKREIEMKKKGVNAKYSYINAEFVRELPMKLHNTVKSSPRKTSDVKKLLFDNFMQGATAYFAPSLNYESLQTEFAKMWDKDPEKLFIKQEEGGAPMQGGGMPPLGAPPGAPAGAAQMKNSMTNAVASNMSQDVAQSGM